MINSAIRAVMLFLLPFSLIACATPEGMTIEQKKQQTALQIELTYAGLLMTLDTFCSPGLSTACSTPAALAEIRKAQSVADVAVQAITKNVLASNDYSSITGYLAAAMDALKVFAKVLATYGVATRVG